VCGDKSWFSAIFFDDPDGPNRWTPTVWANNHPVDLKFRSVGGWSDERNFADDRLLDDRFRQNFPIADRESAVCKETGFA
jgi:hypothetical protein